MAEEYSHSRALFNLVMNWFFVAIHAKEKEKNDYENCTPLNFYGNQIQLPKAHEG